MGEILFLAHRVPWPPNRGDKIRSHHILRKLMELAPVHLACFADDENEGHAKSDIEQSLASCKVVQRSKPKWLAGIEALASGKPVSLTSFDSTEIRDFVDQRLAKNSIDCIFVFSGQMAQFIPDEYSGRVVMDFADVDSAKFESYSNEGAGPMAWINRREGQLLRAFEHQVGDRVDQSLFVSSAEARLFEQRSGISADKITAMGNGIDLDFYDPAKAIAVDHDQGAPLVIFTGQMDYRPNVQAVSSFSREVMPLILAEHPGAQFAIVGRAPTDEVQKLDGLNGTAVIGAVEDIRSWLKAADVVVAPLRIARGIQNKVLEAMAMGKVVVASTAAAEGIDAVNGDHFLVATDTMEEAAMVCGLLANPERAAEIGETAASLIRSRYSWEQQLAVLPEICGFQSHPIVEAAE